MSLRNLPLYYELSGMRRAECYASSPLEAEAKSLLWAINQAYNKGYSKIIFESDSLCLVNALQRGILKKLLLVLLAGFCVWAYQACNPPPPRICGSPDGPVVSSSRIKLRDGRYLAYEETGVPKEIAKSKIIFVHSF
ncbi:alpha/beta hydrolase fold protein, partial [Tanacetum coccineum]